MGLEADFNTTGYRTYKINDYVLGVSYTYTPEASGQSFQSYDFLARVMITRSGSSDGGTSVVPFSQLDSDSLETLRQRLIDLKGKPPELKDSGPGKLPKTGPVLRP